MLIHSRFHVITISLQVDYQGWCRGLHCVGLSTRYVHAILGFEPGGAPLVAEHANCSVDV